MIIKNKAIDKGHSYQRILFIICLIAYTSAYLSRDTFSALMPNILSSTDIVKSELGMISTVFLIFYGAGQLVSGILADKFAAHRLVAIGLLCSGIANFLLGYTTNALQMVIVWGINGFALSMLWAPLVKVMAINMDNEYRKKALVNISISMSIGTFIAFVLSALFSKFSDFRYAFHVEGLLILFVGLAWVLITKKVLPTLQARNASAFVADIPTDNIASSVKFSHILLASGLLFITLSVMCNGIIRSSTAIWVTTYLTENFKLEEFISILTSTLIPIVNLGGIYVVSFVYRRTNNELLTTGLFFAISAIALLMLVMFNSVSPFISVMLLGIATASMQGANAIFMGFVPLGFERYGKVATVTGFLNASAYLAASLGNYGIGIVSSACDWNAVIIVWVVVTALGGVASFGIMRKWFSFKRAVR